MESLHDAILPLLFKHKIILIVVSYITGSLLNEHTEKAWLITGSNSISASELDPNLTGYGVNALILETARYETVTITWDGEKSKVAIYNSEKEEVFN